MESSQQWGREGQEIHAIKQRSLLVLSQSLPSLPTDAYMIGKCEEAMRKWFGLRTGSPVVVRFLYITLMGKYYALYVLVPQQ